MAEEGQYKGALKLLKVSIKKFIGFSPMSQLIKSYIEFRMDLESLQLQTCLSESFAPNEDLSGLHFEQLRLSTTQDECIGLFDDEQFQDQ